MPLSPTLLRIVRWVSRSNDPEISYPLRSLLSSILNHTTPGPTTAARLHRAEPGDQYAPYWREASGQYWSPVVVSRSAQPVYHTRDPARVTTFAAWREGRLLRPVFTTVDQEKPKARTIRKAQDANGWKRTDSENVDPHGRHYPVLERVPFRTGRILIEDGQTYLRGNERLLHERLLDLSDAMIHAVLYYGATGAPASLATRVVLANGGEVRDFWHEETPFNLTVGKTGDDVVILNGLRVMNGEGRRDLVELMARRKLMTFDVLDKTQEEAVEARARIGDAEARAQLFFQSAFFFVAFQNPMLISGFPAASPPDAVLKKALDTARGTLKFDLSNQELTELTKDHDRLKWYARYFGLAK